MRAFLHGCYWKEAGPFLESLGGILKGLKLGAMLPQKVFFVGMVLLRDCNRGGGRRQGSRSLIPGWKPDCGDPPLGMLLGLLLL